MRLGRAGRFLIAALAAGSACGGGAVSGGAADPGDELAALADDAIVVRMGCDTITAGRVRGWQTLLAAVDAATGVTGGPRGPGCDFVAAREDLAERLVVRREAARAAVEVDPGEVDRALALVAERNGRTAERLLADVAGRGGDVASYRELVGADVLRFKLLLQVMVDEGWPGHEEVVGECRRRHGGRECAADELGAARDDLRQALTMQWMVTRGAAWLAERRAAAEAAGHEETEAGCVERPPAAGPGGLR